MATRAPKERTRPCSARANSSLAATACAGVSTPFAGGGGVGGSGGGGTSVTACLGDGASARVQQGSEALPRAQMEELPQDLRLEEGKGVGGEPEG